MPYRIAIASDDGEYVNQHFGKTDSFLIYEISDEGVVFVEDREIKANSSSEKKEILLAEQLRDCKAVFVTKIGMTASRYLYQQDIKSFQVDFSLNHILNVLVKNERQKRIKIL